MAQSDAFRVGRRESLTRYGQSTSILDADRRKRARKEKLHRELIGCTQPNLKRKRKSRAVTKEGTALINAGPDVGSA